MSEEQQPVPPIPADQSAAPRPKRKSVKGKKKQATVIQTLHRRPSVTVKSGDDARAIWREYRREGLPKTKGKPKGFDRPHILIGDPLPVQVTKLIEGLEEYGRSHEIGGEERFRAAVDALFPRTFLLPWPELCGKEREELKAMTTQDEILRQRLKIKPSDGRLLPGMKHEETL